MTEQDSDRPKPAPEDPAPTADSEITGRRPRGAAPPSELVTYVAPVDLPENQDDSRRTREIARIQISPDLDPRRRATVRRVVPTATTPRSEPPPPAVPRSEPPPKHFEATAPLGTNLRAIAAAEAATAKATRRIERGEEVFSPSPPALAPAPPEADAATGEGPRGTQMMRPRARGGTRMMIAGVADDERPHRGTLPSANRPSFALARGTEPSRENDRAVRQVIVLGSVVVLGLVMLVAFTSKVARQPGATHAAEPPAVPSSDDRALAAPPPPAPAEAATGTVEAPPSSAAAPEASASEAVPADSTPTNKRPAGKKRVRPRTPGSRPTDKRTPASEEPAPVPMFERGGR